MLHMHLTLLKCVLCAGNLFLLYFSPLRKEKNKLLASLKHGFCSPYYNWLGIAIFKTCTVPIIRMNILHKFM